MNHVFWRAIAGLLVVVFATEIGTGFWFARHPDAGTGARHGSARPIGRMIRQTLRPDDLDSGSERLLQAANLHAGPSFAASVLGSLWRENDDVSETIEDVAAGL